eukprot:gnl/Spiro4/16598_TR8935_c0_g1_i1.p1 gnl/Spiro4/16598_TR8935_c0_g1~~gnl/Spiro4/16598_TR8935_c0_g1_i1.p1  ORF type:complete len:276 (+),score=84.87 gnl/Spiro4/16598_TR8935_c0_g1_i1:32-829(+)
MDPEQNTDDGYDSNEDEDFKPQALSDESDGGSGGAASGDETDAKKKKKRSRRNTRQSSESKRQRTDVEPQPVATPEQEAAARRARADALFQQLKARDAISRMPPPSSPSPSLSTSTSQSSLHSQPQLPPSPLSAAAPAPPLKREDTPRPGCITVTKTMDFAGEAIVVTKQVSTNSKEGKLALQQQQANPPDQPKSRLRNILEEMKREKISTIDKTKLDWDKFKAREGISAELDEHKKDGYLERQAFLARVSQRTDENYSAAKKSR